MTLRLAFAIFAVAALLPLSGCDETSNADTGVDEADVITDAQIARQNRD